MINFIQPYSFDGNIGKAYNDAIEPLDGWICITDQDTLKFYGFAQRVKQITEAADTNMLIGCMVNRLRKDNTNVLSDFYYERDISTHLLVFEGIWAKNGVKLERSKEVVAGVFMLFHKSLWEKVKFKENEINFDNHFSVDCRKAGFVTMVAKGLYIFHLYKWNL